MMPFGQQADLHISNLSVPMGTDGVVPLLFDSYSVSVAPLCEIWFWRYDVFINFTIASSHFLICPVNIGEILVVYQSGSTASVRGSGSLGIKCCNTVMYFIDL